MSKVQEAIQGAGGPSKVAARLGCTVQAVCFYRDGKRRLPAEYCPTLEQMNEGRISRKDLRPDDWHLIWPELAASLATETEIAQGVAA